MTEVDSENNGLSISMIHVSGRFQPSTGWSVEEKKKKRSKRISINQGKNWLIKKKDNLITAQRSQSI